MKLALERVVEEIATDDHARRELLWLRAKAKGDERLAGDLERTDPEIVMRLRIAGADLGGPDADPLEPSSERFDRLWDECYERHSALAGTRSPRAFRATLYRPLLAAPEGEDGDGSTSYGHEEEDDDGTRWRDL